MSGKLQPSQAPPEAGDPVAREAPVRLDLGLARTPGADPAAEPLQVRPQAAHPRQVVLELGQLHLQLSLGRVGVVGEDVEDDGGAVDHGHAQRRLQVALLARRQLVVAGDQVGAALGQHPLQLAQLPAPQVAVRVGPVAALHQLPLGGDARRAQELLQLRQRVALAGFAQHADGYGALTGTRIRHPRTARAVARLGGPAVAGALHWCKCRLRV